MKRKRPTDKERLNALSLAVDHGEVLIVATGDKVLRISILAQGQSLRQAIDAAMRAQAAKEKKR